MTNKFPSYSFDENLRELPDDQQSFADYIQFLEDSLHENLEPQIHVNILSDWAVALRMTNDLEKAEEKIHQAMQLVIDRKLGLRSEIQLKIRWAHIIQWKQKFKDCDQMYRDIIYICRTTPDVRLFLDFALQHYGKSLFEQKRFAEALPLFEEALNLREFRNAPADQLKSTQQALKKIKKLV